ncbi:Arc family DNA binding domain-containing protein [Chryseobacterium sp.]|uniref:Arc family DNA binding domain-containing protein n=1 Tax=Chryseobacterium sp. TaxID=1871047 RepID=UPI00388F578D
MSDLDPQKKTADTNAKAKKSFVLRIDDSTYKLLEKWASDEFRSVNGHIEYLLHQSLAEAKRSKK